MSSKDRSEAPTHTRTWPQPIQIEVENEQSPQTSTSTQVKFVDRPVFIPNLKSDATEGIFIMIEIRPVESIQKFIILFISLFSSS